MSTSEFIDGAILFRQQSGFVRLVQHDPDDFRFWEYHELLVVNAFPQSFSPFYSFTFDNHLCFCHSFHFQSNLFAIIVITRQFYPELYWTFFRSIIRDFDQSPDPVTPECRFLLISSLLKSWRISNGNQIFVQSSSDLQYITVDTKLSCFSGFNPLRVIDSLCNPVHLWIHILSGHPIRVIGKSPANVAYAVFGLASLTFPFPYRNKIVLAASDLDPRLSANAFLDCAIVGYATTRKQLEDSRFAETISVSESGGMEPDALQHVLEPKFLQFARLMETILTSQLELDPYSDYLQLPFTTPEVMRYIPEKEMMGLVSIESLKEFEATETAKRWRSARRLTPHLREFFLSVRPEEVIETKTPAQVVECEKLVNHLMEKNALDEHFMAVLQRHKHLIHRRFRAVNR
jgi:hypothetical protein